MSATASTGELAAASQGGSPLPGALGLLPEPVRAALRAGARERTVEPEEVLARAGTPCTAMWIVDRGAIAVRRSDAQTSEVFPVALLGPGGVYGAHAARAGATHGFAVVAAAQSTLLEVPGPALARALEGDPTLAALLVPAVRRLALDLHQHGADAAGALALARACEPLPQVAAGGVVVAEGAVVPDLLLLVSGTARFGDRLLYAGELCAPVAWLVETPAPAAVVALEPAEVRRVSARELRRLGAEHPSLGPALRALVATETARTRSWPPQTPTDLDFTPPPPEPAQGEKPDRLLSEQPAQAPRVGNKPFYHQRDAMDCGAACLRMVTRYHGQEVGYRGLKMMARVSRYGTSLYDLGSAAESLGYVTSAVEVDWDGLQHVDLPAIAHLRDRGHFVVVWRAGPKKVVVGDPSFGTLTMSREEFERSWQGVLLLCKPTDRLIDAGRELERPGGATDVSALRLWPFVRPYRGVLWHVLGAALLAQVLGLAPALGTQVILDRVLAGADVALLDLVLAGLVATALLGGMVGFARSYLVFQTSAKVERAVLESLYRRVMQGVSDLFQRFSTTDILNRFGEVYLVKSFIVDNALAITVDLFTLVTYGAVILAYQPVLGGVALAFVPLTAAAMAVVSRFIKGHTYSFWNRYDRYHTHLLGSFKGFESIKAHALEEPFFAWLTRLLAPTVEHGFKVVFFGALAMAIASTVDLAGAAALLWIGARRVIAGQMSVGELMAVSILARQMTAPVTRLVDQWRNWQRAAVSLNRIGDLLEEEGEQERTATAVMDLPAIRGHVRFEGVTFRYAHDVKEAQRNVIEDVTMEVLPGEVVGLAGRSGCGKSTLVRLLLRMEEPQRGAIWVDGFNLRDITPHSIRAQLGLVTQDVHLMSSSIYDNIACGRPVTEAAVIHAAQLAGAYEFVCELPYGFHTLIGERGLQLSGGQKQRVIIARALVTDPRVLVFDEATASLDPLSEQLIHGRLREVVRGRTTFIISHRLAALRHCDRIAVMDHGRIVEMGTHEELEQRRGLYHALASASPEWGGKRHE